MQIIDSFQGKYRFLSNFYECQVWHLGLRHPSVEHAYQAAKTNVFEIREIVSRLPTPGKAKRFGKTVLMRDDWEQVKIDVMRECLDQKFMASHLAERLLQTGNAILIEGNTWGDQFWGEFHGEGKNWLGRLLMERRRALREASK